MRTPEEIEKEQYHDLLGLTRSSRPTYRAWGPADFASYIDTEFSSQHWIAWHTQDYLATDDEGRRCGTLYKDVSNALSLLVKAAGCFWACRKGDHLEENLLRRVVNYSLACCRVATFGLYDEALALLRSLSEVANLIQLFALDATALKEWTDLSISNKWKRFKPQRVRERIAAVDGDPIVDQLTYSRLCEFGAHVSSSSALVSHQADGSVYIGAHFSGLAFVMILNELAVIIGRLLPHAGKLVALQPEQIEQLEAASKVIDSSADDWLRLASYRERIDDALRRGDAG